MATKSEIKTYSGTSMARQLLKDTTLGKLLYGEEKPYIDGYGREREHYMSPTATTLRKVGTFLGGRKVYDKNGEEMHIIAGDPPAVNIALSPLMLARKAELFKKVEEAKKALDKTKSSVNWLNTPELRIAARNWTTAGLKEAREEYARLLNIYERIFGEASLFKAKGEFEKIKQVKAGGAKVGKALQKNPYGPAGIPDLKNAESPYLRQVGSVANEAYAKARGTGATIEEAKAAASAALIEDLSEMYIYK